MVGKKQQTFNKGKQKLTSELVKMKTHGANLFFTPAIGRLKLDYMGNAGLNIRLLIQVCQSVCAII